MFFYYDFSSKERIKIDFVFKPRTGTSFSQMLLVTVIMSALTDTTIEKLRFSQQKSKTAGTVS